MGFTEQCIACQEKKTIVLYMSRTLSHEPFAALDIAIEKTPLPVTTDSQVRAQAKLQLPKVAIVVNIGYMMSKNDSSAADADKFLHVLSIHYNFLFGDAIYHINKNHQTKLRRPAELPLESVIEKLKDYIVSNMKALVDDEYLHWTKCEYIELRDMAASRLTLFNA